MALQELTRGSDSTADFEVATYKKRSDFSLGASLSSRSEVLLWPSDQGGDGFYYQWLGAFPKNVAAGSTPATSGGIGGGAWLSVGDGRARSKVYDIRMFGAVLDGVTDDTAAWNRAENYSVIWPGMKSRITGQIRRGRGTTLQGAGRTQSMFVIDTAFNMSATSCLDLTGGETAAEIYDIGFQFVQANQGVRANCTKYPWAITAIDRPRFIMDRIRIENAWNGIRVTGNSGGAFLGFLEIGALNNGLDMNGAADFMHGGHWHFWPFGIVDKQTLYNSVYSDQTTVAATLGNMDGFNVDSISTFGCRVVTATTTSTVLPLHIGMFQCDGNGSGLRALGGKVTIGQMYSTKLNTSAYASVYASGTANVEIGILVLSTTSPVADVNTFDLAVIKINGGRFQIAQPTAQPVRTDGGLIIIDGVRVEPGATNYTQPHMVQAAGILQVRNTTWTAALSNTGLAVQFVDDDVNSAFENCNLNGWSIGIPASSGGLKGTYQNLNGQFNGDIIAGDFVGVCNTKVLLVTADAAGSYTGPHGIANGQYRVLSARAFRRGGNGEASLATIGTIDGTNISVTGGTASARLRIVIDYMTTQDVW